MSYDIDLVDENGDIIQLENDCDIDLRGGTYCLSGIDEASFNITYNYAKYYRDYLDKDKGIRWLYGQKAKDCIERLEMAVNAITTLPCEPTDDYWKPTPENAAKALETLLALAKMYPEGTFQGD